MNTVQVKRDYKGLVLMTDPFFFDQNKRFLYAGEFVWNTIDIFLLERGMALLYEFKRGRVGFITYRELEDDYVMYDFPKETLVECNDNPHNFRSDIIVSRELVFVVLDLLRLPYVSEEKDRLALYIRNDLILFVSIIDPDESILKMFNQSVQHFEDKRIMKESEPEKFLCYFLDVLILNDRKFLENMEHNMSVLERDILNDNSDKEFINEILSMKKELMYIWNYYDQLIDLGEILRDNEMELFPVSNLKGFEAFTKRVIRLNENVISLKEYTVQLKETYEAVLSFKLNNIMKLFTVITAIFLPLSLIVGWYGMNFYNMPELKWKYGYSSVVVLSVFVVIFCLAMFKKRKLL